MEEKLFGRIVNGLNIVHESYVEVYTKYGLNESENAKSLMEKIFQETYQIAMNKLTQKRK